MNLERDLKARAVANFLAICVGIMQEHHRRPDYRDLLVKLDLIGKDLPHIKRLLIYLSNTEG